MCDEDFEALMKLEQEIVDQKAIVDKQAEEVEYCYEEWLDARSDLEDAEARLEELEELKASKYQSR